MFKFRDGTPVSSTLVEKFSWEVNYPSSDPNATCIHLSNGKIVNNDCNKSSYYSGAGVITGLPNYISGNTVMHMRGYICETRSIHTAIGNHLCVFPFRYLL